ncbi:MAG: rRNA maturation RNase YbeY [Pyrinomonadaceae bacterium]
MIVNLQRKVKFEASALNAFAAALAATVEEVAMHHFSVAFVSDRRMKELNKLFRDKDSTTDVLSFRNEPDEFEPEKNNLGDIVISAEQAQKQASENGLTLDLEIKQLILHGVLHLCGYDHETDRGEMNAREIELRKVLNVEG